MKLIYKPKGAAGEYARYAVNFYLGCPNGCKYCYLKRGVGAKVLGGDKPTLRAGYDHVMWEVEDFRLDVMRNTKKLIEGGLFLSFTTDPMVTDTYQATIKAVEICLPYGIPVTILTKYVYHYSDLQKSVPKEYADLVTFGVTLTGHDELEPWASRTADRISMLEEARDYGFRTFVSLEPVIDFVSSIQMICDAVEYTDEFRIGLRTPVKRDNYPIGEMKWFVKTTKAICERHGVRIVWKESFLKLADKYGINDMTYGRIMVGER